MRSAGRLLKDIVTRPPLIMALIGGAHVLWLGWAVSQCIGVPLWSKDWIQVAWMVGYTVCWLAACDLKRWGALSYMGLTIINVSIAMLAKTTSDKLLYSSSLFILDGLFSFLLLIYYKRLGPKGSKTDT